jgi:hypothetical protein
MDDTLTTSPPKFDPRTHVPLEPEMQKKLSRVLVRAAKDEAWRNALIANPKPILEEHLGISIPPNIKIMVHEAANTIHLMLPPLSPQLREVEISDAELEVRPGGKAINIFGCYDRGKRCGSVLARTMGDGSINGGMLFPFGVF